MLVFHLPNVTVCGLIPVFIVGFYSSGVLSLSGLVQSAGLIKCGLLQRHEWRTLLLEMRG
jgi:hypothetical protein